MLADLGDVTFHYQLRGHGRPLLLLHGWPLDHRQMLADMEPAPFARPTLIVAGRQDAVTGYRDAWRVLENFPRATFAVLDRAGHTLTVEQSGLFRALVHEWLDRVEETTA